MMSDVGAKALEVLSAGSTVHGLRPCAEMFARDTGIPVHVATDHGHNIHRAAMRGEAEAAGLADKETTVAIGAVRIGAAVRADAPRPAVATLAGLRQALLAADAVLLTAAPTGEHLTKVIGRLGLADATARKLKRFETSALLNRHLVEDAGAGAIGFGPATEILSWRGRGVAYAGAIPEEIQVVLS
jgi:hypothetical protein